MKCPKCGYTSFDFLENCKKCGQDLQEHKAKYGLRSLLFPELLAAAQSTDATGESQAPDPQGAEDLDLGFDFMAEQEETTAETVPNQDLAAAPSTEPASEQVAETSDTFTTATEEEDFGFSLDDVSDDSWSADVPPAEAEGADDTTPIDFGDDGAEDIDFDFDTDTDDPDWQEEPAGEDEAETAAGKREQEDPADPFDSGGSADFGRSPIEPADANLIASLDEELADPDAPETAEAFTLVEPDEEPAAEPLADATLPDAEPAADEPLSFVEPEDEPVAESLADVTLLDAEPAIDKPLAFAEPEEEAAEKTEETLLGTALPTDEPLSFVEPEDEPVAVPLAAAEEPEEPETDDEETAGPPLGARLAATACDILVLAVILFLFLAAGEWTLSDTPQRGLLPSVETLVELAIPYFIVFFTLCFGYFTLFHFLTGQTPGKMLFHLRVEGEDGSPLTFSQAFLRSVGGLVSLLAAGLGFLVILFRDSRRGWNDDLAGSRLVRCGLTGEEEQDPEPAV
ncbi:putative RDD family membrane protein YckC [Geothermobacter ehrlichii]|uniref:Putative RDD family membrane protein YckC n=1 Tax=Geothermobacter ehrlichii TaxID=213224 RepID=A0A5D3WJB2_9BACT|nr:RDD family protein [Geothermobacter ehrlichii]TYO98104.1 putative RDD family membrane protein YckC [Geothermobacter ehrlichii]